MELFFDFWVMGTPQLHAADDPSRAGLLLRRVPPLAEAVVDAYMRTVQTLVTDPLAIRLAAARTVRA